MAAYIIILLHCGFVTKVNNAFSPARLILHARTCFKFVAYTYYNKLLFDLSIIYMVYSYMYIVYTYMYMYIII